MALQFSGDQIKDLAIDSTKIANSTITASQVALGGSFAFTGALSSSASPSGDSDVANKAYVDNIAAGLHWKDSVRAASTANLTLSGTQTVDGVALTATQRILVKAQSTGSENGIYVVAAGAWARAADMSSSAEFSGAAMFVREGTTQADTGWVCTNDADPTVGTTAITFAQFSGGGALTGGSGITISGNTVNVDLLDSGSGLAFSGGELGIGATAVTDGMLAGSISDGKLNTIASANKVSGSAVQLASSNATISNNNGLEVRLVGSKGLEATASGLQIKLDGASLALGASGIGIAATGVTNAMLAGSIADSKLNTIATAGKVSGSAVQLVDTNPTLANNSGLEVRFDANGGLQAAAGGVQLKVPAGAGLEIGNTGVKISATGVTNAMLAGSIADSKMLTIATANKVSGSAVQINSTNATIEDSTGLRVKIAGSGGLSSGAAGLEIGAAAVSFGMLGFQPRKDGFAGNGSTAAFNLTARILDPNWADSPTVTRNGQVLNQVASGPTGVEEYTVADNGTNTVLTFGTAPSNGDVLRVAYMA